MGLHPTLKEMIQVTAGANNPPLSKLPLCEVREGPKKIKPLSGEPTPLAKVMNHIIHFGEDKIPLCFYYPRENAPRISPFLTESNFQTPSKEPFWT